MIVCLVQNQFYLNEKLAGSYMNILYSSIPHGVLEYDDLSILTASGHRVFSLGDYWNAETPPDGGRGVKPEFFAPEFTEKFRSDPDCCHATKDVSREFFKLFDIVLVSGVEGWLLRHLDKIGSVPIIFRTIGQSNDGSEAVLKNLHDRIKIVRYSANEVGLPGFARTDAVIYFGKDLSEYPEWVGGTRPITFHSGYINRDAECSPSIRDYVELTSGTEARLYGVNEAQAPNYVGIAHYTEQFKLLSTAACYVYVWSRPPSYTLSLIEAMLVGLPIVAPSAKFVSRLPHREGSGWIPARYEVPEILSGDCGLIYDTIEEGQSQIKLLIKDRDLSSDIAKNSRRKAREKFSSIEIGLQWNSFMNKVISLA